MKSFLRAVVLRDPVVIRLHEYIASKAGRKILHILFLLPSLIRYYINCLISKIRCKQVKRDFALVVIVKNEGAYVEEFIKYYATIGIRDIVIFDNESDDDTAEVVKKIDCCNIYYHYIKGKKRQIDAYNIALNKYNKSFRYLMFFDADEFLFDVEDRALKHISELMEKARVGGIGINWVLFGSSGIKSRDRNAPVCSTFLYRSRLDFYKNNHVKTVCNTDYIIAMENAHYGIYKHGYDMYDCGGHIIHGPFTKVPQNGLLRINHYFTKSFEEFIEKRNRGKADSDGLRSMDEFKEHDINDVFDNSIMKYQISKEES